MYYKFIGEEKYNAFINKFCSQRDFFLNCDLERINSILVDYAEMCFSLDLSRDFLALLRRGKNSLKATEIYRVEQNPH